MGWIFSQSVGDRDYIMSGTEVSQMAAIQAITLYSLLMVGWPLLSLLWAKAVHLVLKAASPYAELGLISA